MADYLIRAKSLSDALASAGSPIAESDLNDFIIDGLGFDYHVKLVSLTFIET